MRPLLQEIQTTHTPETLAAQLRGEPGLVLLRSALFEPPHARYSFVAVRPFLTFRSFGSRCELDGGRHLQFGDPWKVLDGLMARYELLDEIDLPFPLGGCFGYWGYDLKNFVEPHLPRRAANDLELPDCHAGFYDSLVVFDHCLGKTWIVSTGLRADGSSEPGRARTQMEFWRAQLLAAPEMRRAPAGNGGMAGWFPTGRGRNLFRRCRARAGIHPGGRHLPGEPVASFDGGREIGRAGNFSSGCAMFRRAFCGVFRLRGFSALLLVARAFSAAERRADSNAADQGDAPARGGGAARRAIGLRTANQRKRNGGAGDDHRFAAERFGEGLRIRLGAGAGIGAAGEATPMCSIWSRQ